MKRIGMIIAVEFTPFKEAYGEANEVIKDRGFEVSIYKKENFTLYVIPSGEGEVAGAICTQYLIDKFDVEMILNYGVVGGLSRNLGHALTCIVKEVVDYRFDTSAVDKIPVGKHPTLPINIPTDENLRKKALEAVPSLLEVRCASGDRFVDEKKEKEEINATFACDICEMEAAGILLTSMRNNVPALFIKVIADTLFGGANEYSAKSATAARECVKILNHIMETF